MVDRAGAADVVLLGPGFCDPDASVDLLERVVPRLQCPLVVDALGSAYLTEHPEGLHHLEGRCVLTVNPTELALTAGRDADEVSQDPLPAPPVRRPRGGSWCCAVAPASTSSRPRGTPGWCEGGGPGLGISGSGDVQAGIVAGLLARGADAGAGGGVGRLPARAGRRAAGGRGRAPSASWPGSCRRRCPPCWPSCAERDPAGLDRVGSGR